jgi:hypothetical protein
LRRKNLQAYLGADTDAGAAVRSEWRLSVTAYARSVGIPMPTWSAVIGRPTV